MYPITTQPPIESYDYDRVADHQNPPQHSNYGYVADHQNPPQQGDYGYERYGDTGYSTTYNSHGTYAPAAESSPPHIESTVNYSNDMPGTDPHYQPLKKPSSLFKHILHWWRFDILSSLVSLASLMAIFVVLLTYNGKSQTLWGGNALTINGLVAILATICRGAVLVTVASVLSQEKWNRYSGAGNKLGDFSLIDEASRGSFGSLKLIASLKATSTGSIGAALTILSLAFGTFSQQLVTFETREVASVLPNPLAAVPRSTHVDNVNGFAQSYNPAFATNLAAYNGFMSPFIENPAASCPTGNCTWPIIPTVAVCGSCMDLTEEIRISRSSPESDNCVVSFGLLVFEGLCETIDWMQVFTVGPSSGRIFKSLEAEGIRWDSQNLIGTFGAVGLPHNISYSSGLNQSVATECALWYCLQAHEVKVVLGKTEDNVVQTWSHVQDLEPGYTGNITFKNVPGSMNVDASDKYGMSFKQVLGMSQYLNKTFIGNVSADGGLQVLYPDTDFAGGMHRGLDDTNAWIDRLARSMTNEIRLNNTVANAASEGRYHGTTNTTEVVIVVRWKWIIYPAALVLLSMAYLFYAILYTTRLQVQPWKADALVPLCLRLDNDLEYLAADGFDDEGGINKKIGESTVKLQMDGNRVLRLTRETEK